MLPLRGCQQQRYAHSLSCLQELVVWVRGFRNQLISDSVGAAWWALFFRDRLRAR